VGSFRFVFLADTQLGCYATFSGFDQERVRAYAAMGMKVAMVPEVTGFEWDAAHYRRAVAEINTIKPAFVMIGGDMIDDPNVEDQTDEFFRITGMIDPDIPVRFAPGNHDIAFDSANPTADSIRRYRDVFGPDHYSFRHDGVVFVVMNTTVIDRPDEVPREYETQIGFLTDELETARRLGAAEVVLVGHHPLFVVAADEPDTYWNLPLERRQPILDLIHANGVRIGFAGHWHRNSVAVDRDYTQVTSGPVGVPLGDDPSGLRVVDVDRSGVHHRYRPLEG